MEWRGGGEEERSLGATGAFVKRGGQSGSALTDLWPRLIQHAQAGHPRAVSTTLTWRTT